jgi:LPS-assembly protein
LRAFPQLALEWSYPFLRRGSSSRALLEPVAQLVLAPRSGNSVKIPNEDSVNFEFDDTNLWSPRRFPGRDRVQSGSRVDYGMRAAWYGDSGAQAGAFLGQSYRLQQDNSFGPGSGLEGRMSDLVGRLSASPNEYFDATYRFRYSQEDWVAHRHELSANAGPQLFRVGAKYNYLAGGGEFADREELGGVISSRLDENWIVTAKALRDLTDGGGMLSWGGSAQYQDECFDVILDFTRDLTRDRNVPPSTTVMLRMSLKYLGDVSRKLF